jgi:hypothetical protein
VPLEMQAFLTARSNKPMLVTFMVIQYVAKEPYTQLA